MGLAPDEVLRPRLDSQPGQACLGRVGKRPQGRIQSCGCQCWACLFLYLDFVFGWVVVKQMCFLLGNPGPPVAVYRCPFPGLCCATASILSASFWTVLLPEDTPSH